MDMLVQEVKNVQQDPTIKQKWQDYCSIFGNNQRDPSKHTETFLNGFLQGLQNVLSDTNATIFVGGLPHDVSDQVMMQYFSQYGEITKLKVMQGKGFGFVTFKSEESANTIIANYDGHSINGKAIECKKKTLSSMQPHQHDQQTMFGPMRGNPRTQLSPYQTNSQFRHQPPIQTIMTPGNGMVTGTFRGAGRATPRQGPAANGVIEGTEIFVGGLPLDITEQLLLEYFSRFGDVTKVELKIGKGYAFMGFTSSEIVDTIIENNELHVINGKKIECKKRVLDALQQAKAAGVHMNLPGVLPKFNPGFPQPNGVQQINRGFPMQQQFRRLNHVAHGGANPNKFANPEPGEIVPGKIFVGRLPHGTREPHLIETFQLFGNIVQIDVKVEKGFAFVHFDSHDAVQNVMAQKDNICVGGQPVDCKPADGRPPKLAIMQQMGVQA